MTNKITIGRSNVTANHKEAAMTATSNPEVAPAAEITPAVEVPVKESGAKQALPGTRANMIRMNVADLTVIEDKTHALYDPRIEDALNPDFVRSIASQGIEVPVLVAKIKLDGVVKNVVIDGKQRHRAATKVNSTEPVEGGPKYHKGHPVTVPALLVKGDERGLYALMILTNENRREDTPIAKARKVERFISLYLGPVEGEPEKAALAAAKREAAVVFGVTVKTIEGRQKLLATAPAVQKAVEEGRIGWWAASEFSGLPAGDQEKMLDEVIGEAAKTGKKPTVEGAKVKAGKGDAPKREKAKIALEALKDAALDFAEAKASSDGVTEARERLLGTALAFHKASEAARKESAKAREAAKGE